MNRRGKEEGEGVTGDDKEWVQVWSLTLPCLHTVSPTHLPEEFRLSMARGVPASSTRDINVHAGEGDGTVKRALSLLLSGEEDLIIARG